MVGITETKSIELTQGEVAIVDASDYDWLSKYNWCLALGFQTNYAVTTINGKWTPMHRLLMGEPEEEVDHRDRNGLNNVRSNLRIATHRQNMINMVRPQGPNGSGYRGVFKVKARYRAKIKTDPSTQKHLGYYDTAEDAARAYDTAAREYHGEFAVLNFGD